MAKSSRIAANITVVIVPALVLIAYIWVLGDGSAFTSVYAKVENAWSGLSQNDTVQAYREASVGNQTYFKARICADGSCMTAADLACGFVPSWVGGESEDFDDFGEAVEDCFSKLVRVVPGDIELQRLQYICGQRFMTFRPRAARKTPEDCEAVGRQWGLKAPTRPDATLYLEMAGVSKGVD